MDENICQMPILPPLHHAHRAISDWIILGHYTGFQASKWSQKHDYSQILDLPSNSPDALISTTFEFFCDGSKGHHLEIIFCCLCLYQLEETENQTV